MLDSVLQLIAPHHCCSCGAPGALLCDNCKYDITQEPFLACLACGRAAAVRKGLCGKCKVAYDRAWCVSDRTDALKEIINVYKFNNAKAASKPLADLLDTVLPDLPLETIIIPIPTIPSHIRQRGYDHMALIAKNLAKRRRLHISSHLIRRTSSRQRDATASVRRRQAKEAFAWRGPISDGAIYLLIDDVVTTGSTLHFAAKTLRDAGARQVWAAAISRQPLD